MKDNKGMAIKVSFCVLVVLIVIAYLFQMFVLSKEGVSEKIVGDVEDSGSTESLLKESTEVTNSKDIGPKSPYDDINLELMEFSDKYDMTGDGYAPPVNLYNSSNFDVRQKEYLGESYEEYRPVLNKIHEVASQEMSGLVYDYYWDNCGEMEEVVCNSEELSAQGILENDLSVYKGDSLSSDNPLRIVDMFNNQYVVYAQSFPENNNKLLLCVDYGETLFTSNSCMKEFGCTDSITIISENCSYKNIDGWDVIFLKNDSGKYFDEDGNMFSAREIIEGVRVEW